MNTDEQYGRQLGVQLRHEMADVQAAPNLVWKLRRRQARRTWAIRGAIAAPVAAVAAAAIVMTTAGQGVPGGGHQGNNVAQPANGGSVRLENVAYVQAQTVTALGQAKQYVTYANNTYEGGHYDNWIDKATQRYRNDIYSNNAVPVVGGEKPTAPPVPGEYTPGPIRLNQSQSVSGPEGDQDIVIVDYDLKTWSTMHVTDKRSSTEPDMTDADSIRKAIDDGAVELVGKDKVNGLDTLHLRVYGPKRSYRIDMWVDSKTFLPVKGTSAKNTGKGDAEVFPAAGTVTTTYSWLPRTKENLARLVLTPPPGFDHKK